MNRSFLILNLAIVLLEQNRSNLPKLAGWPNEEPYEDHLGNHYARWLANEGCLWGNRNSGYHRDRRISQKIEPAFLVSWCSGSHWLDLHCNFYWFLSGCWLHKLSLLHWLCWIPLQAKIKEPFLFLFPKPTSSLKLSFSTIPQLFLTLPLPMLVTPLDTCHPCSVR